MDYILIIHACKLPSVALRWAESNRWTGPMCESLRSCSCWAVLQIYNNLNMSSFSFALPVTLEGYFHICFQTGTTDNRTYSFFCIASVLGMDRCVWRMITVSHLKKKQKAASWRGESKKLAIWERDCTGGKACKSKQLWFLLEKGWGCHVSSRCLKKSNCVLYWISRMLIFHSQ